MEKMTIHRKETTGEALAICTAVLYTKDSGLWRLATKVEGDLNEVEVTVADGRVPMFAHLDFPSDDEGSDGDFYAVLYPLNWNGPVWRGDPAPQAS